jgi:NAD(P)-dependent dehydrogenase (short-subunit alcohol dehydrogenase family)
MTDPARVRKAIAARRRGASLVEAAAAAGVHVATLCRWQAKDPELQEALDDAKEKAPLKGPMPGPKPQVPWHRDCPLCRMPVVGALSVGSRL